MKNFVLTFLLLASLAILCNAVTTQEPSSKCEQYEDCEKCVKHSSCLWCNSNSEGNECVDYPKGSLLPDAGLCPLDNARWGVCWVNYKKLLIAAGVIGGVILLIISSCCVYCCCCKGNAEGRRKFDRDMDRIDRDTEERRIKSEERRTERQVKYDDIRKKYGITKDQGYTRFDSE